MQPWRRIGDILCDDFGTSRVKIEEAAAQQAGKELRLGETLVAMQAISPETLAKALAAQSGLPFRESLADAQPSAELLEHVITSYSIHYTKLYDTLLITDSAANIERLAKIIP